MASFRKRSGVWYYRFTDEDGRQRERKGCTDRRETESMAGAAEAEVAKLKAGYIDAKDASARHHENRPLVQHIAEWQADLVSQGHTAKHADHTSNRVRRLVAIMTGSPTALLDHRRMAPEHRGDVAKNIAAAIATARLSDLTRTKVQDTLAKIRDAGWSLQTANHYRAAVKAFSKWCFTTRRIKNDDLLAVKGYNAKEDRRHDRRTISLDELRKLVEAARRGPTVMGMTGLARSLCYRLAATTGLRYSEIGSITADSFDWVALNVTVEAAYTKNGNVATLSILADLVEDLQDYVATIGESGKVFPLPTERGAKMLRVDLKAAGIPYRDASDQFFDFHSLRCEMATLADAAGVTPRVVQKLMRHSSLELTGRYTRPRMVDIESAAAMLPSLKPDEDRPESMAATGTDGAPINNRFSLSFPLTEDASGRSGAVSGDLSDQDATVLKMANTAENKGISGDFDRKAPPGFEPGMEVLQTSALPLGYGAATRSVWLDHSIDRFLQPSQREGPSNLPPRSPGSKSAFTRSLRHALS